MKPTLISILLFTLQLFTCKTSYSQMLDSATLAMQPIFEDIATALQAPDKVFRLNLSKKKLTMFPSEIFLFKHLQELNISKNKIYTVPEKIKTLHYLQYLNLSGNKLKYLPDSIGELTQLIKLVASRNDLLEIPKSFGNLSNLKTLDLWENDIGVFPEELSNLKKLKWLDLRVILIDEAIQQKIQRMLPDVKIFFSPSCHCVTG